MIVLQQFPKQLKTTFIHAWVQTEVSSMKIIAVKCVRGGRGRGRFWKIQATTSRCVVFALTSPESIIAAEPVY